MQTTRALICCASACAMLLAAAAPVAGQSFIGRTIDVMSGNGLEAVDVELIDSIGRVRARAVSDTAGWFRIRAPAGTYTLNARVIGFSDVASSRIAVENGKQLEIEVRMQVDAVELDAVRVVAERDIASGRLGEYFRRAEWVDKSGFGRVYRREDIERIRPIVLSHLIRTVPTRNGCPLTYLLNGLPITLDELDSMVTPDYVEGVEIYRTRIEVPPEYAGRAQCGVVLVWTREDMPGRPMTWTRLGIRSGIVLFVRFVLMR
jgi:hypothetical protein